MNPFEDLIPQNTQSSNPFEDLIPKSLSPEELETKRREDETRRQEEILAETPWLQRQAIGAGAVLSKAGEGVRQLFGGAPDEELLRAANTAIRQAPVGAFAGEVMKFAPAMLAGGIAVPAAVAAGIGAAATPGDMRDRLTAGALEGGMTAAGGLLAKGIYNISPSGLLDRASNQLRQIIGEGNLPAVRSKLSQGGSDLRPTQMVADVPDAANRLNALESLTRSPQGITASKTPLEAEAYWRATAEAQEAARLAELQKLTGARTAEEALALEAANRRAIEESLGPVRRQTLASANVGQDINRLTAEAAALRQQAQSAETMGNYAALTAKANALEQQAAGLSSLGYAPLDTSVIAGRIESILGSPKTGTSTNVQNVLGQVENQIDEWVKRGGGNIDANALYGIRKQGINEAVDKLLAGTNPAASKKLAASLSAELRPMIDDAIERAGGTGWKDYVKQYGARLEDVDRQRLLAEAMSLYKNNPNAFMNLVKGESPDVVKNIMTGKTALAEALPDFQMGALQKIAGEKARDLKIADVPKETFAALQSVLDVPGFRINLLNRWFTLANTAIDRGAMKMERGVYQALEGAMRDPKKMLALIDRLPSNERSQAMGMLLGASGIGSLQQ